MSTASRNCWFHLRRLQAVRNYARAVSESFGGGPWALRPKRLQWLMRFCFSMKSQNRYNITVEFKIAAFQVKALSLLAFHTFTHCICGLEAGAETSPPIFLQVRAPP